MIEIKFKGSTLLLGVLTGASTLAMLIKNQTFTYVTGTISILTFICSVIIDIKYNNV